MEPLLSKAKISKTNIDEACIKINIDNLNDQLTDLREQSIREDFWQDSASAQDVMRQIAKIETKITPWIQLRKSIKDLIEMLELKDTALLPELNDQLETIDKKFNDLQEDLKFVGPFDDHGAILSIYAGAGGTDAQDWTQMLFRMYSRYADRNELPIKIIDESPGEEAGLKSISLEIDADYVYGRLKGEQGVHRLVRLSPFNADNLRQTSFAKVEIIPKIESSDNVEIDEKDLKIDVYRSGGHGGQSVNTTDSAVRITHIPTGITVAIQNERSQLQNRETAMTILKSRLTNLQLEQNKERLSDIKGPNQSAEWGNQIRSYVLHPYKQVKDLRTKYETSDPDSVLDGNIEQLIDSYLRFSIS
jgi:peptide chain release factor 2